MRATKTILLAIIVVVSTSCAAQDPPVKWEVSGLPNLEDGASSIESLERGEHVVLLFSPTDCSTALRAVERLNELATGGSSPVPAGIVNTPYPAVARKAVRAYGLRFPVYLDTAGRTRARFGAPLKPVLLRISEGRVVETVAIGSGAPDYDAVFRE